MYYSSIEARRQSVQEVQQLSWSNNETSLNSWWFQVATTLSRIFTTDGESVIILSEGCENDGPGPDVLNAHLILGDREVCGSVEFHQKGSDWYGHGHHQDPVYEGVVLHIVHNPHGGPDLPTVVVAGGRSEQQSCIARRPVCRTELMGAAWKRFERKQQHFNRLDHTKDMLGQGLMLGMIEILCAGANRQSQLQTIAVQLGLEAWPDARAWHGSRQSYPLGQRRMDQVGYLLKGMQHFDRESWKTKADAVRLNWSSFPNVFHGMGLSVSQQREWVVNILAPSLSSETGFSLWLALPRFRGYGVEKKIMPLMGLNHISNVAQQQALLWWYEKLCKPLRCNHCPLC